MRLETIVSELHFAGDTEREVLERIRGNEAQIAQAARTAYQGEGFQFPLCGCGPLTRLAVVTYLLPGWYAAYRAKGIPDGVILDTFRDVSLRARLYSEITGRAGLSEEDVIWFRHLMHVALFQIGALQFQPFEMIYLDEEGIGEPYMAFSAAQKAALPAGTPVINCHVPRGADLSPRSVEASFQSAKAFFSKNFPDGAYRAFLCYSWLLYPPMVERLPETSNIRRFAERFRVVGACDDAEQAFECLFMEGPERAPAHATALQRLALRRRELFGFACGVIGI